MRAKVHYLFFFTIFSAIFALSYGTLVPRALATNTAGTFDQSHFGWRNDNGGELISGATYQAATNTPITSVSLTASLRIRIATTEGNTCAGTGCSLTVRLEYSTDASSCTTGTWTTITSSSAAWKLYDSANFTNAAATTQQLTSGTFTAGSINDTSNPAAAITITKASRTEHEWAIQGNSPSSNTTYRFRLTRNGTVYNTYTQCAQLTTIAGAPTVTTQAASSVTSSSATVNGNITATNGASATDRGFASSTSATMSSGVATTTESGTFGTGAFTGSMGGLTGNTTYYFRPFATNTGGTGFGSILSFLTLPGTPGTPTYTNTIATTTGITWTAPTGGASSYKLEQCQGATCSFFTSIGSNSTTTYSLVGNTTYNYAVRGNNTTGDGAFSATSSVLTVPDVPGTPTFSGTVATSTTVSWTSPTGGVSTYKLQYCVNSSSPCTLSTGLSVTSTTTNPSLVGNTTYSFAVRGTNATGDGYYSASSTRLTVPDVPNAPSISNVVATSTTVTWSAPTGGSSTYKLQYCVNGSSPCTLSTGLAVTSTTTNPSLVGNTTYSFAVLGTNATGDGLYSASTTQLTTPDIPGTPTFGSITETTLTVSWSAPTGGTTSYKLERCAGSGCTDFVQIYNNTTASYDDSSLSSNTVYRYRVRATNATGNGLYSSIANVTTADTTPPAPDPASFSSAPSAASVSSVSMTATTETDAATPPVEYYFGYDTCAANNGTGGTDSGWQSSVSYTDSGLQTNKCYGYTVRARDSQASPNMTASSSKSTIYTLATTPSTPTLGSATQTTLTLTNAENGNPSANPTTKFAASITASSPTDSTWQDKYVDSAGNPTATETWLSDSQLDNLVLQGLTGGTDYTIKVAARNEDLIKTASSTGGTGTTLSAAPGTPSYTNTAATTTGITWTASSGATSYKLEQCSGGSCSLFTGILSNSTTTYSLVGNTSYDYAVRAVNASGDGAFSATSTVLTLPNVPGTPTFADITATTLTVNWTAPTGGASTYKLERCTGSGCTNFVQIQSGLASPTFGDSSLSSNTVYVYRVRGTNATGDGLYSASAEVTTDTEAAPAATREFRIRGGVRFIGGVRLR